MKTYVALLRGINVGGKNTIPMSELKKALSSRGYEDVVTYIQTGNVVFRSPIERPLDNTAPTAKSLPATAR